MKVLIIEDDQNKKKQILSFLEEAFKNVSIVDKHSYKSGLKEVVSKQYDLILLDMSMPTFDITVSETGGKPMPFAGKEILRQMKRRSIRIPTIVVTQFEKFGDYEKSLNLDELNEELEKEYREIYVGTVYYNPASSSWREDLKENLKLIKGVEIDKNINS
ncbi:MULTISPECIES: response regulator [Bacillus]|uniref:response regulator n=1 Tax=Bacillus TaxID=1386 RepID=UPI00089E76A6|nr:MULTISPECIES: response regulator [Bacillus]PFR16718.1 response regulator [Bacillus cereus]PGT91947.1 response regulator [Bacillus cereus]SEG54974.1 Response regulator receiver domain-containing protein [Bacillus sp. ok061]